jgi:hypothetical protein
MCAQEQTKGSDPVKQWHNVSDLIQGLQNKEVSQAASH